MNPLSQDISMVRAGRKGKTILVHFFVVKKFSLWNDVDRDGK